MTLPAALFPASYLSSPQEHATDKDSNANATQKADVTLTAGYAASGAVVITEAGAFTTWSTPDGEFQNLTTSEIIRYTSRTNNALTVPSEGRGLGGTSPGAGVIGHNLRFIEVHGTGTILNQILQEISALSSMIGPMLKTAVRAAVSTNDSLSGLAARDGVTPIAGDRLLCYGQTTQVDRGIWVAAAGAWSRATDLDASAEIKSGLRVFVREGTVNAGKIFKLTTNDPITLGATNLSFAEVGGADDSTIEISSFLLRLKDAGTTQAKLAINARPGPNHLINGGMRVMQRVQTTHNTYFTTAAAVGSEVYVWDRWKLATETLSMQATRFDTNGAIEAGISARYYAKYNKITGVGKILVRQILTGTHAFGLHGRQVTFQVKMKANTTRTIRLAIVESTGVIDTINLATMTTADTTDITFGAGTAKIAVDAFTGTGASSVNSGVSCPVTTAWQLFSITCTIPTTPKNLMLCIFSDSDLPVAGELMLAEAGLYDGASIRDYTPEDEATEVGRCLPFCCKSFLLDRLPAQNIGVDNDEFVWTAHTAAATVNRSPKVYFPTRMRGDIPTITLYSPNAISAQAYDRTLVNVCTATTAQEPKSGGFWVNTTAHASTAVGNLLSVHWLAESEI